MASITLTDQPLKIHVTQPLTTAGMLARAILCGLKRPSGNVDSSQPLKRIIVRQDQVTLEADRIELFRQCCKFDGQTGGVPLPFPETYFTPLMAQAMVAPEFPLSPVGIIHMYQRVTQHKPLEPGQSYNSCCELTEMRSTDLGVECDFDMQLTRGDELHWSGLGTMLSRSRKKSGRSVRQKETDGADGPALPSNTAQVSSDLGRRFAKASGDYNPIHLWKWTAMPMGFSRPIAHGMWTFSRVLGMALASTNADQSVTAEAYFKRPLFLPGTVQISTEVLNIQHDSSAVAVQDAETGTPHLTGQVAVSDRQLS